MSGTTSITNVGESRLIAYLESAHSRLVYLAPGASLNVAKALGTVWRRLGRDAVMVILDVDPEVCRLGFGTLDGLKHLRDTAAELGALVCHQPGVRIGLVISDNRTLIFSPTPLLIESGSDASERPNGIELTSPPEGLARDLGLASHTTQQIGLDPVSPERIAEVESDLEAAPPVKFDLARRVRVFTSRFQFVELEMTGCFISRKRVRVPSRLIGLAGTQNVERNFRAQFNVVQTGRLEVKVEGGSITERSLLDRRRKLEREFLVTLPGYGAVVLRAKKDGLVKEVEQLKTDVDAFSSGVRQELEKAIQSSREAVVAALLPAIERNPPPEYTKVHGPSPSRAVLRRLLERDIERAFGSADDLVKGMQVKLVFKDVAYESLVDEQFLQAARDAMPDLKFLHDEYEAVPARQRARS